MHAHICGCYKCVICKRHARHLIYEKCVCLLVKILNVNLSRKKLNKTHLDIKVKSSIIDGFYSSHQKYV